MTWKEYALASAFFAGLTALFGKLGVQTVNSNLATFVRVMVIAGELRSQVDPLIISWRGPTFVRRRRKLSLQSNQVVANLSDVLLGRNIIRRWLGKEPTYRAPEDVRQPI